MIISNLKQEEMERAYRMIRTYSSDALHYLTFNEKSSYFFGEKSEGFIAYEVVGRRAMSMGDPVCLAKDMERLTVEYIDFCKSMKLKPIFNSVSKEMKEILKGVGYTVLKYGQEAVIEMKEYSLAGGRRAALRRNVSKNEKAGVALMEYIPQRERNLPLEREILKLSEAWYDCRSYTMSYSIGRVDFGNPYDRRFFVTRDEEGNLLTFISFLPYESYKGYCLDIMHRDMTAQTGVMEHAIISAAMQMRAEGVESISLGVAPLAGLDSESLDVNRVERIMNTIFHHMDYGYNFKNLYRFKKKFAPSRWETRYLVYHPGIHLFDLALTITNTKRGSKDVILYLRYKLFLIGIALHRYHPQTE